MNTRIFTLGFCFAATLSIAQVTNVRDIQQGPVSAIPSFEQYAICEAGIVFRAKTPAQGEELWITDGTENGTVLLQDIYSGSKGSQPYALTELNGKVFFIAENEEFGRELWVTDGTGIGTQIVRDIRVGSSGSMAFTPDMTACPTLGIVLFSVTTTTGIELWKSDGTEAGTVLVKDIQPDDVFMVMSNFKEIDGIVYFLALSEDYPIYQNYQDLELWRTDGTEAGTYQIKDVNPGHDGSFAHTFTGVNNTVLFIAHSEGAGYELWATDGTSDGTYMVKDIWEGIGGGLEQLNTATLPVLANGEQMIFAASTAVSERSLWTSDGTEDGTIKLADFSSSMQLTDHTLLNGELYLLISGSEDEEGVWITDGTPAGTQRVIPFELNNQTYTSLTAYADKLIISARRPGESKGIYISDGTEAGTNRISNVSDARFYGGYNDLLYFSGFQSSIGREVWVYDPKTTSAPTVVTDHDILVFPNPASEQIHLQGTLPSTVDRIALYDMTGRIATTWNDLRNLRISGSVAAGKYTLTIESQDQLYTLPVLISRQ